MAGVWLPPTIEEDEEIAVDESDSEEEVPSKEWGRNSARMREDSIFNDGFSFPVEGGGEGGWEVEEEVMEFVERKKDLMMTSLDSKILRAIEQRKLKVYVYTRELLCT